MHKHSFSTNKPTLFLSKSEKQGHHSVWKSQKKVSFNIASEASYIHIWSGQKLIKDAKNSPF